MLQMFEGVSQLPDITCNVKTSHHSKNTYLCIVFYWLVRHLFLCAVECILWDSFSLWFIDLFIQLILYPIGG